MCGIAGEVSLGGRVDLVRSKPMINTILHRGPDDIGAWADPSERVALLHCRLSIVDPARGQQPMHSTSGDVVIVFNGEIYGYERIRADLEKTGYQFQTSSDTEVLLALYVTHGPSFIDNLEGEFAFVLYDRKRRLTLAARDRFGVKPLFYYIANGLFLFGSEVKAILAHPFSDRKFDTDALNRRIHGVLLPDETIFHGVKSVLPGSVISIDGSGQMSVRQHAKLDPQRAGTAQLDRAAAEHAFEDAMFNSVQERLHGHVDVGVYLSGGVDSTLVANVIRDASNKPHRAFTIGFDTPQYAEAQAAAATAERLGFEHDIEVVSESDLDQHFVRSLWHAESIIVNAHGTAKMCLSKRASQHVKVILAGEGADELHGGYAYYRHAALIQAVSEGSGVKDLRQFLTMHSLEDNIFKRATPALRERFAQPGLGVPYSVLRAASVEQSTTHFLSRDFRTRVAPDPASQLMDWIDQYEPSARTSLRDGTLSRYVSIITDLPGYNLSYLGDRSEMANSIEGRLPFLDKRVADLLWSLPDEFHIADQTKTLIRSSLAKRSQEGHANRYKRMFVAPGSTVRGLFEGPFADKWLSAAATRATGVFDPKWVYFARKTFPFLPSGHGMKQLLERFLLTVLSVHILDELFVKNFEANAEKFQAAPVSIRHKQRVVCA